MGYLKEFLIEVVAPKTAERRERAAEKLALKLRSKEISEVGNTREGRLLLEQIKDLERKSKNNNYVLAAGIGLVVLSFVFGAVGYFLIVSVELIVGVILIAVGLNDAAGKRLETAKLKLASLKDKHTKH